MAKDNPEPSNSPNPFAAHVPFEQLRALKINVGHNDLRIAAIVLENNAVVVTRNVRDFERVPGLLIENRANE